MALLIRSLSSHTQKPYHHHHLLLLSPVKPTKVTIKCQKPTADPEPTNDPSSPTKKAKKATASGQGFGSTSSTSSASASTPSKAAVTGKKGRKGKRERASVIRRSPVEKPAFVGQVDETKAKELKKNESAFVLAWLGLGGIILVQGIMLAASGFLPEEFDKFFVKYLYPSFTPTVFLFVGGSVAYGVLTYLQNEKPEDQNDVS